MPSILPSQAVGLIDKFFPWVPAQLEGTKKNVSISKQRSGEVAAIINAVGKIPSELIVLDGDDYAAFLTSIAAIEDILGQWQSGSDDYILQHLAGFGDLNPIALLRRSLAKCPNEYPSKEVAELTFIGDQALRDVLRLDISAIERALSNNEWKAAVVLAGSVVEALLLWKLGSTASTSVQAAEKELATAGIIDKKKHPGRNLDGWSLHSYVAVTEKLGLLKQDTITLTKLTKDFRNLIHPGRVQRIGESCDRGKALTAVGAMVRVVRDLTP